MICLGLKGFHLIEVLFPKSRGYFEFYPDFNSSTKAICLSKKELRIKAKVRHLHEKDFYFKIFGSSFYLLSLESFRSRLSAVEIKRFSFRILVDFAPVRTMGDILNSLQKHSAKGKLLICSLLGEFDVLLKFVDILQCFTATDQILASSFDSLRTA